MSANAHFIASFLKFLTIAEKLKCEERDNMLSNGKFETVASHCWMMGLMAMLLAGKMEHKVNLERVLKIIIVHDIAEAITGDLPLHKALETPRLKIEKTQAEQRAMEEIKKLLPPENANEIYALWREYEDAQTIEAKFVKAIDKIDGELQMTAHKDISYVTRLYGDTYFISTFAGRLEKYCAHEPLLVDITRALRTLVEAKIIQAGMDPERYRRKKEETCSSH